jgi:hypothetical protein
MPTILGVPVTDRQAEVYEVLAERGPMPDVVLVPLVQHVGELHQSSSGIRTRRKELCAKNLLASAGAERMPSGRKAAIYRAKRSTGGRRLTTQVNL